MKKEQITIKTRETAIKIQNTLVNAVRIKDIVKKGVRVFDQDKIGIAGSIGGISEEELFNQAKQNLTAGIPYPYELAVQRKDHRNYQKESPSSEELLSKTEAILKMLREEYSDFDFSETIRTQHVTHQMSNSEGLDLEYQDTWTDLGFIFKTKKSVNLFDGFLSFTGRTFHIEEVFTTSRKILNAYRNPLELPDADTLPIVTLHFRELHHFLCKSLNGENYATGSSIFSGKLQEKLFNEKIRLEQNRDPRYHTDKFFDAEGSVLPEDRCQLIEKGQLIKVISDKKTSALYRLPHTGSASGSYDDIPSLTGAPLRFTTDSSDLKTSLNGQLAALVMISAGGDFTSDGNFAAPVQASFLFDGTNILGRLPEFTIQSNIYQMLGKDYIGTFDNTQLTLGDFPSQFQVYRMKVKP
jgi:PmbA protein